MAVTIKRDTGWMSDGRTMHLKLNGESVAKIMNNKSVEINLPEGDNRLRASDQGIKSNEIVVQDGDVVELKPTFLYKYNVPILTSPLMTMLFISEFRMRLIVAGIIFVAIVISMFTFNLLKLEISQSESNL